jgi:hypothetical protein
MSRAEALEELLLVIHRIQRVMHTQDQDMGWSVYDTVAEVNDDLEKIKTGLLAGSKEARRDLSVLFLPTGDFQEIAMSSGWSALYHDLGAKTDEAIAVLDAQVD